MSNYFTSATCPACETFFDRVPCEREENGAAYAIIEVTPCTECGEALCACCPQFACDACGQTVCQSHVQEIENLKCCSACHAALATQPEEVLHCPACKGTALRGERVEMQEPGYRDVEYRFSCLTCGETGAEDELVREVLAAIAPKPVQRETRTPNEFTQTA